MIVRFADTAERGTHGVRRRQASFRKNDDYSAVATTYVAITHPVLPQMSHVLLNFIRTLSFSARLSVNGSPQMTNFIGSPVFSVASRLPVVRPILILRLRLRHWTPKERLLHVAGSRGSTANSRCAETDPQIRIPPSTIFPPSRRYGRHPQRPLDYRRDRSLTLREKNRGLQAN